MRSRGPYSLKTSEHLHLAALLHDIGKFRMRATDRYKRHQEHSYEFVNEDFADFFAPCGDAFKNAIRHHHPNRYPDCRPNQLQHLIEKQVILADRLSATEREDQEREGEDFVESAIVSILSRLKGTPKEYRYPLKALDLTRDTVIPTESPQVNQDVYADLWQQFKTAFETITRDAHYTPTIYQTIVALLEKYTSRMPSATPWGQGEKRTVPDISLYDHLRTTAAIAACLGRELSETEIDGHLFKQKKSEQPICALIKGDISGIQSFLYQILSEGAARELRGRSFYLQLLAETIAHWVLKQFDLPITNLILASGGHFYILAPYSEAREKLDTLRRTISENLWALHKGDLSCILAGMAITADDFEPENFSKKWYQVSQKVQDRKRAKWSEMAPEDMFENFFEPHEAAGNTNWGFGELGRQLRDAEYLVAFEVPPSSIPDEPAWGAAMKAFGWEVHPRKDTDAKPMAPPDAERAIVYRLGDTEFLTDASLEKFRWDGVPVSYDFKVFRQVTAYRQDANDTEITADYDYLANAAAGVKWLGALRMDVDDLGKVFSKDKLKNATISRLATLSASLRLFFEGYVPELCRQYNKKQDEDILELIYAGGDDLFLVGGWSALPEVAERIRSKFRQFVTGDHLTLSGGIAIQHKKYPLYQFAAQSGEAEKKAKGLPDKNAITFLRKPMAWTDFQVVRDWHQEFLKALRADRDQLPRSVLTRLSQIYADEKRWAWRSLYNFHRLEERYKAQIPFLRKLQHALNFDTSFELREFIHIIIRWTALRIRNQEH
ncbi:type III-A CRISPR-associated protein Cas10/Csm1 [Candidatus Poribacteria bacterium]|nr:type III-A CRISPR-associated protein Cas10/Csm1 [Candidatus Poribacteria bacterium]